MMWDWRGTCSFFKKMSYVFPILWYLESFLGKGLTVLFINVIYNKWEFKHDSKISGQKKWVVVMMMSLPETGTHT